MAKTNLYVLGSGIYSGLHLSIETVQALRACQTVFLLHDDKMVFEAIKEFCSDVRDLLELYQDTQKERRQIYIEVADRVVNECKTGKTVALMVHGNPMFLVSACEYTIEFAREQGLNAKVLPAISSFDTILCDLEIDLGYGVQIFDPESMIANDWTPNPKVPLLLFQLAQFRNAFLIKVPPKSLSLAPLSKWLCQFYPPDHQCKLLHSGAHILENGTKLNVSLKELCHHQDLDLGNRPTLYVPSID
ncbi:SAM-dependent methyltransferase [Glaciimonas immobilis]|uniref:Uncharacterized protein YabN with tetrapyrrole methylase and pyrophosphatase domain n=1 Tax=Glaciimonas immobilis TaxID=728004 RepID=A0A840RTI4_9BURK|nr:SAM-dependent methyltransferase [Glaciimonas immobilis]KAF3997023.1 hypothetical protein HAV38_15205 [Glaciimonas immobilis]MBB5199860.1 uncharacterized protein YabN with tetrapyrrole methylase and pyrophosphatase domain [Glaciimonas immobilis]